MKLRAGSMLIAALGALVGVAMCIVIFKQLDIHQKNVDPKKSEFYLDGLVQGWSINLYLIYFLYRTKSGYRDCCTVFHELCRDINNNVYCILEGKINTFFHFH